MRTVEIYGLARQQLHRLTVFVGNFVVRQVWMKIERGDIREEAELVKVSESRKRGVYADDLDLCTLHCWDMWSEIKAAQNGQPK
jgi:hypothetical protein